jgi:hypothetical protein
VFQLKDGLELPSSIKLPPGTIANTVTGSVAFE